jgi:hypothetical protein
MFHDKLMFGDGKFYLITIVSFSVFFSDEFSQKFDLKDAISTNTKDFWWKKWSSSAKFRIARFLE